MSTLATGIYCSVFGLTARRTTLSAFYRGDAWYWLGIASCVVLSIHLLLLISRLVRRKPMQLGVGHLRSLFILLTMCWLYIVFFIRPYDPFHVHVLLGISIALFSIGSAAASFLERARSSKGLRAVDLVLTNICVAVVGAEIALGILSSIMEVPIFSRPSNSVSEMIAMYRYPPKYRVYGYLTNSTGHYDTDFRVGGGDETVYATIGDSFSIGIVPHPYHFTTLAEKALGDAEVYNFGLPAVGPREYLHLLEHEVLRVEPNAVVINIFVGNDILQASLDPVRSPLLSSWFNYENVLISLVPTRIWKIQKEEERLGELPPEPRRAFVAPRICWTTTPGSRTRSRSARPTQTRGF